MLGCKHTPHIGVTNHHSGVSGTAMKEPPATKKKTHVLKGETLPLLCVTLARRLPRQVIDLQMETLIVGEKSNTNKNYG